MFVPRTADGNSYLSGEDFQPFPDCLDLAPVLGFMLAKMMEDPLGSGQTTFGLARSAEVISG